MKIKWKYYKKNIYIYKYWRIKRYKIINKNKKNLNLDFNKILDETILNKIQIIQYLIN